MCNCNNNNPCIPNQTLCSPPVDCTCPVRLNSECVTYNGKNLECSGINSGLPLNQTLELLDAYVCEAIAEINSSINLINVGTGEDIYAGIDGIGRRKIKRVNTDSNILTITPNTDDITFGIDEEELTTFVENLIPESTTCITSENGTIIVTENEITGCTNIEANTIIQEGDNITITGIGSPIDPYIINSQDTVITLENGVTTVVNGDGVSTPYSIETKNAQKEISSFPYTLTSLDDKHTIFVNNGISNVTINVPDNLVDNFACVFIQEGTGTVSFLGTGTSILNKPTGYEPQILDEKWWVLLEKKLNTSNYYLGGNLLPSV